MRGLRRAALAFVPALFLVSLAARAEEAAEVTCKDGTKSHAGKGACSGHGGVDKGASSGKSSSGSASGKSTSSSAGSASGKSAGGSAAAAGGGASTSGEEVTCKDGTKIGRASCRERVFRTV